MKEKTLQEFGLTRNEAKVYLTLLKLGSCLAGEITERSGIHRRNVYDSIERLIEKGLVSFVITNNRKYFTATDPKRFLGIIGEERHYLQKKEEDIKKILPELLLDKKLTKRKQDVYFFRGIEGLKFVYDDILRVSKDYIGYGPAEQEGLLKVYFIHFIEQRKRKKIRANLIYNENARNQKFVRSPLIKVRFLPEQYSSHAALRIYGNKTAILLFSEEPLAILIENKSIADGYRKYFNILWNTAKK